MGTKYEHSYLGQKAYMSCQGWSGGDIWPDQARNAIWPSPVLSNRLLTREYGKRMCADMVSLLWPCVEGAQPRQSRLPERCRHHVITVALVDRSFGFVSNRALVCARVGQVCAHHHTAHEHILFRSQFRCSVVVGVEMCGSFQSPSEDCTC